MSAEGTSVASPSASGALPQRLRLLAYPLFFASGMAALVYEVVWTRMLIYTFGAGIYAVTAVLAAFMAGLALGSALLGRASDRLRHPIRFYAVLEFLISICGFALPALISRISDIDAWAYAKWGQNFQALTACRFIVSFFVLLIPTTLMGATLPVLTRAMTSGGARLGLHIGELYAINTAGAVAGAFVSGFYFIERYGVLQTEYIAAILNLAAAAGALVIGFLIDQQPASATHIEPTPSLQSDSNTSSLEPDQIRLILLAAFVTGFISLAAQVIWFRSLVFAFEYLKNTTYAFSAMLTVFLLGLSIGSAIIGTVVDKQANPMRLYGILLLLLGVSMAFSVSTIYSGAHFIIDALGRIGLGQPLDEATQKFNWPLATLWVILQSTAVLGLPTLLMGMALPVAARAVVSAQRVGGETGFLYALNTAGAILGSIAACFIIVPILGLTRGLLALAAADSLLGVAILFYAPRSRVYFFSLPVLAAGLFALAIAMLPADRSIQHLNKGEHTLFYEEGPLATVSVLRNSFGYHEIFVDGVGVAGTDPMLQTDQKSLAHLPMLLVENPRSALTVGFGSGGASYSYLLHNRLEKVHCAEICETVTHAAPLLTAANHGLLGLNDPRYKIILDDARSYLKYTHENYDIIATDCTDLRYKSNANLYDLQYFEFCRARLNPGGVVVVWMPLGGLSLEMFKLALRTFHVVFPEMAVFYMDNEPTHYILLVGWRDKMSINFQRIAERLQEPDVRADLAELQLDDPVKLLSTFITGGDALKGYLAGDALNTENRPRLEFESPKYGYQDQPILDNLASLMAIRRTPAPWIESPGMPAGDREKLDRYEAALPHIIDGHARYRRLDIEGSAREYIAAQKLTPDDKSLDNLLGYREIVLSAGVDGTAWPLLMLGRVDQLRGNAPAALRKFDDAQRLITTSGREPTATEKQWLRTIEAWRREVTGR